MITTALNIPGQSIYSYVKETRTKNELATIALALATFSGITSCFIPLSYTFASFSAFIIYAGQFNAAKSECGEVPDFLNRRIIAISLSIIIGAKIGQKIREYRYPAQTPSPWYSVSLKTPLHLFNNLLAYVVSPIYLNEIVDLKAIGHSALLPGEFICSQMDTLQTGRDKTISLIGGFSLGVLVSYWISLSYTFSTVIIITLFSGSVRYPDESLNRTIPLHFFGSLYLFLLGSKIGKMVANYCFPSSLPWYSVNWKTPFHIMNNAMIIGIPVAVILAALSYIDDPRSPLPDLDYTPRKIDKNKSADEFNALKQRITDLKGFKIDEKIKSEDDIRAARYVLLVGNDWKRTEVKKNFMIASLITHPDQNQGIDRYPFTYISAAWKVLDPIYPLVNQVSH